MSATTENENENVNPETETDEEAELPANLGDAGKAAIAKERQKAKDAATRAKAAEDRAAALEAKQAEADAAKAKADEAEAIRKGEFEALATTRAEEVKTVTGERDAIKTQLDTLIAAIKPDVENQWKEIPDEIKSFYDGADDDVLAKRAFLAKSKPAIDKLTAQEDDKKRALGSIPKTPRPNGGVPIDAAMDQQRRVGNYKV